MNLKTFLSTHKKIYIFGIGKNSKKLSQVLSEMGYTISGYMDNSANCSFFNDIKVISPAYVNCGIIISVLKYANDIEDQLLKLGIPKCNIYIPSADELIPSSYITEDSCYLYHHPVDGSEKAIKENFNKQKKYQQIISSISPSIYESKKYHVSICAIFKNEGPYLKEWIEYHRIVGVDHFYLYNNMSEDNYYEIVKDYVNAGIVTLIEWPFLQSQIKAYRNCIKTYSIESDWIGFIDLDEFVVPIITNTIGEFLDTKSNYASVLIHWKIFGSNSLIERDITTPVIESFNCCWPKLSDIGKCFYNTHYNIANDLELNASLHHIFWSQIGEHIVPPIDCCNIFCEAKTKLEGKLHQEIQINHYVTKSFKEYTKKMNGTDVYFKNNPHTKEMFDFHDLKCISQDNYIFQYLNRLKQQL